MTVSPTSGVGKGDTWYTVHREVLSTRIEKDPVSNEGSRFPGKGRYTTVPRETQLEFGTTYSLCETKVLSEKREVDKGEREVKTGNHHRHTLSVQQVVVTFQSVRSLRH